MTITIPIATSRADIVEKHLTGFFPYKVKNDNPESGCVDFEIEADDYLLPILLQNFFHAGIETGKKIFQP